MINHKFLPLLMLTSILLAGCSGARIYSIGSYPSNTNKELYEIVGSNHVNELEQEDAMPQIEKGIASVCPDGGSLYKFDGEIIEKSETRSFLLYKAVVECN